MNVANISVHSICVCLCAAVTTICVHLCLFSMQSPLLNGFIPLCLGIDLQRLPMMCVVLTGRSICIFICVLAGVNCTIQKAGLRNGALLGVFVHACV